MEQQIQYLPLGTIVLLKNGAKRLMIYGRCMKKEATGELYDYIGCLYPEGFINPEKTFVFQHSSIEEVVHLGYVDEEEEFAQELLKLHHPLRVEQMETN